MAYKDPEHFLDSSKLQDFTIAVGRVTALAATLKTDAGAVIKDGCVLIAAERLTTKGRLKRWGQLYPVRELIHAAVRELRAAADRLDAEWQQTEDALCAPDDGHRRRR